jgi:hypothetical protein
LEHEIRAYYDQMYGGHPAMDSRLERDLQSVRDARAALQKDDGGMTDIVERLTYMEQEEKILRHLVEIERRLAWIMDKLSTREDRLAGERYIPNRPATPEELSGEWELG